MVKRKIVHIIDTLEQGGAQKLIFDLVKILKDDFDFHVLTFEGGIFQERLSKSDVLVECLGISPYKIGFKYPQNIFRTLGWLKKKINEINPDIVQTHLLGADMWGRLVAPKRIKIIQTLHSAEEFRGRLTAKGIKTFFFERILSEKTDLIIAVSKAAANSFKRERIKSVRIKVIPVGIDIKVFAPNDFWRQKKRNELKIKNDEILIGAVGRLDRVKGFDVLLKVFSKIKKENSHLKLAIVGGGGERKNLEKLIKEKNLVKQVSLLGERHDVPKLLNAFDIFVLPSRQEGFGIVLLEAAACKKPIVATRIGGIPEFIKDGFNGLLVEPENPEMLAQKINLLLKSVNLRKKIAENAFKTIVDFDIKKIAKQYKKIYQSL